MTRFFLGCDDSAHWYLVEASRRADWDAWRSIGEDDERSWVPPDFARRIDSPHQITFADPQEALL